MKRLFIVAFLAAAIPASNAVAASLFPWWFHTRPKPVFLVDQKQVDQKQVDQKPDASARPEQPTRPARQTPPPQSRLMEFFSRGWRIGSPQSH